MPSDKNREARPEPWRGISVEKKPTNKPKKIKRIWREIKRKIVSWNPRG